MKLSDLRTPSVLIDKTRLEQNVDRMQAAATARGIGLRPHAKTHKSPDLARVQIARGATGICCAKLGEAEVFAAAGIEDIRLPYPINPANADRVLKLLDLTRLSFIVDDFGVARSWSGLMRVNQREVDVLVKVDVGFHRCGIDPDARDAAEMVARVAELPGLRFRGLLSHAGHGYGAGSESEIAAIAAAEAQTLTRLAAEVGRLGAPVQEISVGATPTARFSLKAGRHHRAAAGQLHLLRPHAGGARGGHLERLRPDCPRPRREPAGRRSDHPRLRQQDALERSGARLCRLSRFRRGLRRSRHAAARHERCSSSACPKSTPPCAYSDTGCGLKPGDLVRVLPNHACVVSNLVDSVWLVNGDAVLDELPVAARGRIT